MAKLTAMAPKWRSSVSGNNAPALLSFRYANAYSDTRAAMLFAEKYHELDRYAELRGTDEETLRDTRLSELGLDEQGKKIYDLGSKVVEISLKDDLTIGLYDTRAKKDIKSLPKKNADSEKYAAAQADFADIKKNAKKIAKARNTVLFEAFLNGKEFNSENWGKAYFGNPLINRVGRLLVWAQGKITFTLAESGLIDCSGAHYELTNENIMIAHPLEMNNEEIQGWQKYFTEHGLKQPFSQIWEPVIEKTSISEDRYKNCMIPFYRFRGMEKHGITIEDNDFHAEINIFLRTLTL